MLFICFVVSSDHWPALLLLRSGPALTTKLFCLLCVWGEGGRGSGAVLHYSYSFCPRFILHHPSPFPQWGLHRPSPFPQWGLHHPSPFPQWGLHRPSPFPQWGLHRPSPFVNGVCTTSPPSLNGVYTAPPPSSMGFAPPLPLPSMGFAPPLPLPQWGLQFIIIINLSQGSHQISLPHTHPQLLYAYI